MPMFDGVATPTVTVDFDLGNVGTFVLGISSLGGTDVLGTGGTQWQGIGNYIRSATIRRGRTREDQAMQPGTLTLVLDNRDGRFDPDNSASPYQWNGYSILTRGLGVRLTATYGGTGYVIYRGYLESIDGDQSLDPVATLTFTDGLAQVGAQYLAAITSSYSGDTTAARIGRILDAIGWSASLRSLTGSRQMQPTTLDGTALTFCEQAAACEYGKFFADRQGTLTLVPYENYFTTPNRLTFSDDRSSGTIEYDTIVTNPGAKYLINQVTIQQTSSTSVTYSNATSQARYGTYARPSAVNAPLLNSSDANTVAAIMGDRNAFPTTRVDRIEFDAPGLDAAIWPNLLQTDLGDRATVNRTTVDGRRRSYASVIESVSHDISPYGWRVGFDLSPGITGTFFVLGSSLLGSTDQLYY